MWFWLNRYPKDIFCELYSPDRRFVEFVVEKRNVPGALARVSSEIAKQGINILSGLLAAYPEEPASTWSFFADFTEAKIKPEQLAETLRGLDVVLNVRFAESKYHSLAIDNLHFPLRVSGERSVTFRVESIGDMFHRLHEVFGPGAAIMLYEMGVKAGEGKIEAVRRNYRVDGQTALDIVMMERIAKGWGIPEIKEFNKEKAEATIKVKELFECLPFKDRFKQARSNFFRGYLEGVLRQLFKKDVSTTEVECIAKGDPYCKFIAK